LSAAEIYNGLPSEVINDINSETHSYMVSLASFEIFGPSKDFSRLSFMIHPMFAIGRNLKT